ncbi:MULTISPECIES: orotate phosphoribosyltransferase [unclassified Butyrivibrio]|jgi:orotate phosphoribosyltransferase|uniref:orotate phosphoribosyltransferase n=1 Tax=unclassified Butyrivibrio TaxID=2639466 RepID=UPI0003B3141D|nr:MULTISPECIES: orotate phosphoribosyltransferase [unclassified Butyrivibrio]MDC7294242.1 orotate phosphoribosyltransferase [Butyrivibrio sp. DSM 10294]
MLSEYTKIPAQMNSNVALKIIPGHYATTHSHVTHYMEIGTLKTRCNEAHGIANILALHYTLSTPVDTIVCADGTEVIGTYLADELTKAGVLNCNAHKTIYVLAPEYASDGQIIFRDNLQLALRGKHTLLLLGSLTTGRTLERLAEGVRYYGAEITGACAIFSTVKAAAGLPVISAFHPEEIPGYESYDIADCPLCKQGVPIDALVNSFGYSVLR